MDLHFPEAPPSLDDYMEMIRLKTAALMGLSCQVGALMAGSTPEVQEKARIFGSLLGTAFQLQDDVLGVWGEEAEMGKTANDLDERKWGLPVVLAMEKDPRVAELLTSPLRSDSAIGYQAATAELQSFLETLDIEVEARSQPPGRTT
ncbi:hypothetical protein LCGC14_2055620 [marine sediment metagenome]|uniref:Polyprenyl synthetase n=1 Tax=marine sediment metagenome TaxID=412755 RepID=A0A0F9FA79_9ZZZZ